MRFKKTTDKFSPNDQDGSQDVQGVDTEDASSKRGFFSKLFKQRKDPDIPRKPNVVTQKITEWGSRLLGAATSGGFSQQESEYEEHQTKQDYLWNSIGQGAWGMVFPLFTIIVTQRVGVEQAGMFSFAFVAASLLMILGNYGVRTYQVSDREEEHSFLEYRINRWITCLIMLLVGWAFCRLRGYDDAMFTMTMWVFVYKMIDALADVYEGRLQQVDKLYLAGISQTIRSVGVFLIFTIFVLISGNLALSSVAMGVAAILSFLVFTLPLALLETPHSNGRNLQSIKRLFIACLPAFVALFLYALIDNLPKFMMESMLPYDNQLYFNALYFPAQAILMIFGLIYKPLLVRMTDAWNDLARRPRFDLFLVVAVLIIAAITAIAALLMGWIGIPLMSLLYGIDFEQFRDLAYIMIVAGGFTAGIDFFYQVMYVMRHQNVVPKLYVITSVFAIFVPFLLIQTAQLRGAVMGYTIVMAVLFVLLLLEYISVRVNYKNHPEDDPVYRAAAAEQGKPVPEPAIPVRDLLDLEDPVQPTMRPFARRGAKGDVGAGAGAAGAGGDEAGDGVGGAAGAAGAGGRAAAAAPRPSVNDGPHYRPPQN